MSEQLQEELNKLLVEWLTKLRDTDHSPRTVSRYGSAVRRFLSWHGQEEHRPLLPADLTPIALQEYRLALQKTEATSTVNIHACALRAWCAWLTEQGHLNSNPATHLRLVSQPASLAPRALKDAEINALLREAQRSRHPARDYALLQVMLQTGIRIGECAALTMLDVTFGEKSGSLIIRLGKGNRSRTVPLNASVRSALANYVASFLDVEPTLRAVAKAWPQQRRGGDNNPIWRSQMGKNLTESGIWRVMTGLVRTCATRNLIDPDTTPHDLRHAFAYRYLREHPSDLVGLAKILGYSSLDATAIYAQTTADDSARRIEQLPTSSYSNN